VGLIASDDAGRLDRNINRYENDLGVETRLYFDMVQLLSQLGVMPVPAKN
jgi:hypothetical protein